MIFDLHTLPEMPTFFVRLDILTDYLGRRVDLEDSLGVGGGRNDDFDKSVGVIFGGW